jgi:hypothetical protein
MILEEATFELFGYLSSDLKPKSGKRIVAVCEFCGEFRIKKKSDYHTFCNSCSQRLGEKQKGNTHNEGNRLSNEQKAKLSAARKGKYMGEHASQWKGGLRKCICLECAKTFNVPPSGICRGEGKFCSPECSQKWRVGEKCYNYKGGKKLAWARGRAKRQKLGYILLTPLKKGEEGHHITNEYVIGIPAEVHKYIGGSRKKHRTLVLQWLKDNDKKKYKMVLCVLAKEPLGGV